MSERIIPSQLERAARILREAEPQRGAVPTKKFLDARAKLVEIALLKPSEQGPVSESMNPVSPCCGVETVWVIDEDPGVQCSKCGAWMEFRAKQQLMRA
jgi:hypothetical protein